MPAPQSPSSQPGGEAGRVRCLYCGANNFPTSATCWQCSRPLKAMPDTPVAAQNAASPSLPSSFPGALPPTRPVRAESPLAPKAAAAMGMLFPYVGLPAGILFLMLDDPRKTQLGWMMIIWSIVGTVLNSIALALTLGPVWAVLRTLTPHPGGGAAPSIPGLPADGGLGGDGLFLVMFHLLTHCL